MRGLKTLPGWTALSELSEDEQKKMSNPVFKALESTSALKYPGQNIECYISRSTSYQV